jgi:hypothetical protein
VLHSMNLDLKDLRGPVREVLIRVSKLNLRVLNEHKWKVLVGRQGDADCVRWSMRGVQFGCQIR